MVRTATAGGRSPLRKELFETLQQEFAELHGVPAAATPGAADDGDAQLLDLYARIHALPEPRAALCLSGGGIRSASFALGVLQGLARHGLLGRFHYLSTVSGGGYIGGFLTAWRHHQPDDQTVFAELGERRTTAYPIDGSDDLFAEPQELQGVRADSNFLTPRLGALSGDTLTVLALYLRNLWLNWLIFLPLLLAGVFVPQFCFDFLFWAKFASPELRYALLAAAGICLGLALAVSAAGRPARDVAASGERRQRRFRPRSPLWMIVPVFLTGALLALYRAQPPAMAGGFSITALVYGAVAGAIVYAIAWLVGVLVVARQSDLGRPWGSEANPVPPLKELLLWTVAGAAAGLFIAFGGELFCLLWRLADGRDTPYLIGLLVDNDKQFFLLATAGVPWVMLAILTADLIFTGLASYMKNGDDDREWSGRAAGFLIGSAAGWLGFAGIILYGPPIFDDLDTWVLAAGGGISGIATLVLGGGAKTAATAARQLGAKLSRDQLLAVVTIVFVIFLGIVLSKLVRWGLGAVELHLAIEDAATKSLLAIAGWILCGAAAVAASYFINVNRFSLHAVYRNRLIRAFLGTARANSRPPRCPDPFTDFDQRDNLRMASLWQEGGNGGRRRLFPVVNTSLNIVDGDNLAWQERMAESFAITPLTCGSPIVGFASTGSYGSAEGISLGTAMAISGAAASPNQGYHSSPLVGFLMMLFNVRLGWWLGNPRRRDVWKKEGPTFSIEPIVNELLGRTRDDSNYVYLSDGGHFENLGIYEMIRRRCRVIVVSDAGCDPGCGLEDLGNAVRKVWIDFGVKIEFQRIDVAARTIPPAKNGTYCALGRICYPENRDGEPGYLIYIKPGFHGTEPPDIRSYAAAHPSFPHETTADQWFSESQMESYRALGSHTIEQLCLGDAVTAPCQDQRQPQPAIDGLAGLIDRATAYLKKWPPLPKTT
jgi:hypothetical protein